MLIRRTTRRHTTRVILLAGIAAVLLGCSGVPNLDQGGMGCQNAGDGSQHDGSPTDPGQPLAGVAVIGRTAANVGREAEAKGLVVRYHLDYATTNDGGGYAALGEHDGNCIAGGQAGLRLGVFAAVWHNQHKLAAVIERVNNDVERFTLWTCDIINAVDRLGICDHGRVHGPARVASDHPAGAYDVLELHGDDDGC